MKSILLAAAIVVACRPCLAQDQPVLMFGGDESCATWLKTSENKAYAGYRRNWIYGFFSGANIFGAQSGIVGHTTDQEGIIGEVTKLCREQPSTALNSATAQVYQKLQKENR